jgi:hypothetical protein
MMIVNSHFFLEASSNLEMIGMAKQKSRKRIKINGHYMQVRQRSTKKGRKGTILGKWKPKKSN